MIDEALNKKLNDFIRVDYTDWKDAEWTIWLKDGDEYWYTVLDDTGRPSDDNIIEGSTGEMLYLDAEDAVDQWGGNTIQGVTHQESGVVVFPDKETIICNWSSLGENQLPRVSFVGLLGLDEGRPSLLRDAKPFKVVPSDVMGNVIYDANRDEEELKKIDCEQPAWELSDGTIIIAPEDWN